MSAEVELSYDCEDGVALFPISWENNNIKQCCCEVSHLTVRYQSRPHLPLSIKHSSTTFLYTAYLEQDLRPGSVLHLKRHLIHHHLEDFLLPKISLTRKLPPLATVSSISFTQPDLRSIIFGTTS